MKYTNKCYNGKIGQGSKVQGGGGQRTRTRMLSTCGAEPVQFQTMAAPTKLNSSPSHPSHHHIINRAQCC